MDLDSNGVGLIFGILFQILKMETDKDNHSLIKRSRFECPKCDKSFLYRIRYFKHMQQHENDKTELEPILVDTKDCPEKNDTELKMCC